MLKTRTMLLFLLLLGLFLAGCAAPVAAPQNDQADIDAAVQATLTAVAGQQANAPAPASTPVPDPDQETLTTPEPDPEQPAGAPSIALPPQVANFQAAERPISSLGDPEAPVVMYEWSDYT